MEIDSVSLSDRFFDLPDLLQKSLRAGARKTGIPAVLAPLPARPERATPAQTARGPGGDRTPALAVPRVLCHRPRQIPRSDADAPGPGGDTVHSEEFRA